MVLTNFEQVIDLCDTIQTISQEGTRQLVVRHKFVFLLPFDNKIYLRTVMSDIGVEGARKETACNAGDLGSIPGMGRSPGEENGYPLQSSDLENSMGCIVHGVAKGWPPLSDFHFQSFPGGSDRKESASNARDASLIPGSGRSSGEGNGNPL